jgi:glycosyltransferase involved in cell wall biosynthesis
MDRPVDLLLVTWNRRAYLEKTLTHLMASASDFSLYCWDNASKDGTADLIASLDDPRVVRKHFSHENLMLRAPSLWFFEEARSDVVGKIDDDILLPEGWIERIAPLVRREPRFGMLGCWIYMPEDWDESVAGHKIIEAAGTRVFRNLWIAGQSFLARRAVLRRYIPPREFSGYGFPIHQGWMTADGLVNGYPLPLLFAHNMDDPRSPHYLMDRSGGVGEQAALTARMRGFETAAAYRDWIVADAAKVLRDPVDRQLREILRWNDRGPLGRARRGWLAIRARLARLIDSFEPRAMRLSSRSRLGVAEDRGIEYPPAGDRVAAAQPD